MNNRKKISNLAIAMVIAIGVSALLAGIELDDSTELANENRLGG